MEEVELEEDDFDEDMLALDEITQETVHEDGERPTGQPGPEGGSPLPGTNLQTSA